MKEKEMAVRLVDALCMCLTERDEVWTLANELRKALGYGHSGAELYDWLAYEHEPVLE